LAETVQTRSFVAQTGQFQTPTSLVFRFTGQGHSLANGVQFKIFYILIENIFQIHYEMIDFDLIAKNSAGVVIR